MSTPSSITALEAKIDRLVYGLYGLTDTDTEIAIAEGKRDMSV